MNFYEKYHPFCSFRPFDCRVFYKRAAVRSFVYHAAFRLRTRARKSVREFRGGQDRDYQTFAKTHRFDRCHRRAPPTDGPRRSGAAQEQRSATNMTSSTRTKQGRPLRPTSLRNGCRGEITSSQWSDIEHPLRDNVDMPVPSHYSAAPSGDLCTTYKSQFVVWGESRRSVSITSERPLPPRPELSRSQKALSQKEWSGRFSTSVGALAMECSSMTACALELRAAASNGAGATACSSAKNAGGEQMKHGSVDTGRRREHSGYRWLSHRWTRSASTGRASLRDGLPRNSFFT